MQRSVWMKLVLIVATAAVFAPVTTHDFTWWDDARAIHQNPRMNPPTFEKVMWYWGHAEMDIYMPVTRTVWGVLGWAGWLENSGQESVHLNPWVFHGASVLVHVLAVLAMFALLRQLLGQDWAALAGAMLFALHPVQVESVAWASGMKDLLCGLFTIVAVWQYVEYRAAETETVAGRRSESRFHYALALTACALAMLSKPTAMIAPLLAGIVDWQILGRPVRKVIVPLLPWLALAAGCAIIAKVVQPAPDSPTVPLWARPLIAGDALAFYLWKLIWPARLAVDYGRRPDVVLRGSWVYVAWIIPAAIAVMLLLVRKRQPILAGAGMIFVAALLPLLGFTRFDFQSYSTTADHYLYPAMLGVALAMGWTMARYGGRKVGAVVAVLLALLGVRSALQARHWENDLSLWQHTTSVNPQSYTAQVSLCNALADVQRWDEAAAACRKAIAMRPDALDGYFTLSRVQVLSGQLEQAAATLDRCEPLMMERSRQLVADGRASLAEAFVRGGRQAEAAAQFERALRLSPGHADWQTKMEQARAAAQKAGR